MRPQSCKSKGRRFQQRVAASIREVFGHLTEDDVYSTPMGAPGEDIRLSPLARQAVPLSLECKCVEKLNVWACLEQCERNAPAGNTPCLVFTRNRAKAYAVVPWDVLLVLLHDKHAPATTLPPRLRELLDEMTQYLTPPRAESPPPPSPAPSQTLP